MVSSLQRSGRIAGQTEDWDAEDSADQCAGGQQLGTLRIPVTWGFARRSVTAAPGVEGQRKPDDSRALHQPSGTRPLRIHDPISSAVRIATRATAAPPLAFGKSAGIRALARPIFARGGNMEAGCQTCHAEDIGAVGKRRGLDRSAGWQRSVPTAGCVGCIVKKAMTRNPNLLSVAQILDH